MNLGARHRKFDYKGSGNDRILEWYDAGIIDDIVERGESDFVSRRAAVLDFLQTLKPSEVYSIVEETHGGNSTIVVYYRREPKGIDDGNGETRPTES